MKSTLVIGSTVVDVLLNLPHLPVRGEDINLQAVSHRIGGCAWNTAWMLRLFDIPHTLCSPVGTGMYGRFVEERFFKEGIKPFAKVPEENGCCFCLIEEDGERTFLSRHGAEYLFSKKWMNNIDYPGVDSIFICGIEVEDPTGSEIVDFVRDHPDLKLFFAPGPRIMNISSDRMEELFSCHPILHLNEREALLFTGKSYIESAADVLAAKTQNAIVVTLGDKGAWYMDKGESKGHASAPFPAKVKDTIGAGDAHFGALIACLKQGKTLGEAVEIANRIGAAVVEVSGATLGREEFSKIL
ncbi:PfkB family carbohydrate kinase [Leadbettera azotonutricia]|uniref:Putative sugar kinase n=1 Tax=Leadbettera azotonutricia (strain ATCC BAA-888 / DSM 13862 / ZAS-9) TaxID=545695 RepID=F5YFI3_LEAAZ|nr:PfkB family carbohydrate kinase [Leadbettera azotonutricia]AEF80278.1 putative sugar kinase [Leadbettera azotonutricia ZAS-9]